MCRRYAEKTYFPSPYGTSVRPSSYYGVNNNNNSYSKNSNYPDIFYVKAEETGDTEEEEKKTADENEGVDYVHTLVNANFTKFLEENERVLVEFYAPLCGHCKDLEGKYRLAARILHEQFAEVKTRLARVDGTREMNLIEKYDVQGYPTLILFVNQQPAATTYNGKRETTAILHWIVSMEEDKIKVIDEEEKKKKVKYPRRRMQIYAYVLKNTKKEKLMQNIAEEMKTGGDLYIEFYTIHITDKNDTQVVVYKTSEMYRLDDDEIPATYRGDEKGVWKKNEIKKLIEDNKVRIVHHDVDAAYAATKGERNVAMIVLASERDIQKYATLVEPVATEYKQSVIFSFLFSDKHEIRRTFGVREGEDAIYLLDTIRINKQTHKMTPSAIAPHKYKLTKPNRNTLRKFLEDFAAGALEPHVTSEEELPLYAPDTYIQRLVATNFKKVLSAPKKFKFVMYYSPNCPHCKKLRPVWEQLAQKLRINSRLRERVDIYMYDGTANDLYDEKVEAFPSVVLYPPTERAKEEGKLYEGNRELEDLLSFLEDQVDNFDNAEDQEEEEKKEKIKGKKEKEEKRDEL